MARTWFWNAACRLGQPTFCFSISRMKQAWFTDSKWYITRPRGFDVTTRQFVPVMHVRTCLRRGSIRLGHGAHGLGSSSVSFLVACTHYQARGRKIDRQKSGGKLTQATRGGATSKKSRSRKGSVPCSAQSWNPLTVERSTTRRRSRELA